MISLINGTTAGVTFIFSLPTITHQEQLARSLALEEALCTVMRDMDGEKWMDEIVKSVKKPKNFRACGGLAQPS